MSKIAEKKDWERYPIVKPPYSTINDATANVKHAFNREGYIKGYDQAMQDIEEFFYDRFNIHPHDCHVIQYVSDTPLELIEEVAIKSLQAMLGNDYWIKNVFKYEEYDIQRIMRKLSNLAITNAIIFVRELKERLKKQTNVTGNL